MVRSQSSLHGRPSQHAMVTSLRDMVTWPERLVPGQRCWTERPSRRAATCSWLPRRRLPGDENAWLNAVHVSGRDAVIISRRTGWQRQQQQQQHQCLCFYYVDNRRALQQPIADVNCTAAFRTALFETKRKPVWLNCIFAVRFSPHHFAKGRLYRHQCCVHEARLSDPSIDQLMKSNLWWNWTLCSLQLTQKQMHCIAIPALLGYMVLKPVHWTKQI